MNKKVWKSEQGITLIEIILLILVIILVVFLASQIMNMGMLDEVKEGKQSHENEVANIVGNKIGNTVQNPNTMQNTVNNTEIVVPNLDNTLYQSPEEITSTNSEHYYYNQLDENAKIIYKGIEDNIENMKTGTYKIDFGTQFNQLLKKENGDKTLNIAFQSAWNAFSYDYAHIFYINVEKLILTTHTTKIAGFATHRVSLSSDAGDTYLEKGIYGEEDINQKESYIKNARDQVIAKVQGKSQYEQIKYVHDWLINHLKYDTTYQKENVHNVYGAFANKEVVCEGYARTFKYILDGLGIENVLISGTATNSNDATETHAWNYVKLNGKWYAVDVTWDDPIIKGGGILTDKLRYEHFLRGSSRFFKNHKEDGYLSQNSMKFTFPTIEREDYQR